MKKYHPFVVLAVAVALAATGQSRADDSASVAKLGLGRPYVFRLLLNPERAIGALDFMARSMPQTSKETGFKIVKGLAGEGTVSFKSLKHDDHFLRHQSWALKLHPFPANDPLFNSDASFYVETAHTGFRFRSVNFPTCYLAVTDSGNLVIAENPSFTVSSFQATSLAAARKGE